MQVDESWAEQVESQIRASVPVSSNQAADIAEASWPSCCFSVQFLELASYGVNDVDAARGSRYHGHGINWTGGDREKARGRCSCSRQRSDALTGLETKNLGASSTKRPSGDGNTRFVCGRSLLLDVPSGCGLGNRPAQGDGLCGANPRSSA